MEEMEFNTEGCVKLKEIEIAEDNKTYSSAKGSILSKNGLYLLYCVSTDNGTYKIPDGVEFIDDRALNRKFGDGGYSSDDPTILIEHVIFPDSFEDGHLDDGDGDVWIHFKGVKTITLGAKYCDGPNLPWLLEYADRTNLEAVYVSEENPFYASVDGVLYDKEQETLLLCPTKAKICNIPATVISLNEHAFSYRNEPYSLEQLTVSSENQYYKSVDNVLYTKDGSKLLYCPKAKSGAVTVSSGTSIIGEASFSLCKNVTEIIMPGSVTIVEKNAFKGVNEKAVFKVPSGKKAFFEKLLTAENGFGTKMTVKEME